MKTLTSLFVISVMVAGCGGSESVPEDKAPTPKPEIDIWTAASQDAVGIIQQHIDYGTDINSTFVLEGMPGSGGTALHIAALLHKHEAMRILIEHDADLNRKAVYPDPFGGTPLHWAVVSLNTTGIKALADAGADMNSIDNFGTPPLDVAVFDLATFAPMAYADLPADRRAIYDLLVEKGAQHKP